MSSQFHTEQIARRILDKKNKDKQDVFVDPATIMLTIKIVTSLIRAFKSCRSTPTSATQTANKPSRQSIRQVKRAVRQELGFFRNLREGKKYVDAVLEYGKESTVDDMYNLMQEDR